MDVSPALIPILRGTAPLVEPLPISMAINSNASQGSFDFRTEPGLAEQPHLDGLDDGGNLAGAIVLSLLILLPLWAAMAVICYWLFA